MWTHLLHDHGSTRVRTPLIRFCLTLIQECKLDLNSKTFVLSMLFFLTLKPKNVHEALANCVGYCNARGAALV